MTRNLKVLGLALVAISAIAVSGVGAASAAGAEVTGAQISHKGSSVHRLEVSGGTLVSCSTATLLSTMAEEGKAVTIVPTYSGCEASGNPATITMNGCDYFFKAGSEGEEKDDFPEGTASLVCPESKKTEVHVYADKAHTESVCTLKISPFANKPGVTFRNTREGTDDVDLTFTLTGLAAERTGSIACGKASQTAIYTGATTLRAYSNEAHTNQVDLAIGP